jgi:hypothetical protein
MPSSPASWCSIPSPIPVRSYSEGAIAIDVRGAGGGPAAHRRRALGEPVANAGYRHDRVRVLRISLDLTPQPTDQHVDAAIERLGLATGTACSRWSRDSARPAPRTKTDSRPNSEGVSARSFRPAPVSVRASRSNTSPANVTRSGVRCRVSSSLATWSCNASTPKSIEPKRIRSGDHSPANSFPGRPGAVQRGRRRIGHQSCVIRSVSGSRFTSQASRPPRYQCTFP